MKFVSFNVNSIRLRLHQLEAIIAKHDPEIIGLQETKCQDHDFPLEAIEAMGYHAEFFGQKTHYGVAMLSKAQPDTVTKGFDSDDDDAQKRLIGGQYGDIHVLNGYFPQGEALDHAVKFPAKRAYYADLLSHLNTHLHPAQDVIVMGDMNVAPTDLDIGIGEANAKRWLQTGKTSFLPEEREWWNALCDWGLEDSFRATFPEEAELFSWFDYRSKGFEAEPKRGLRIDQILLSESLSARVVDAGIDYDIRGMEKPSDHCPIWVEIE